MEKAPCARRWDPVAAQPATHPNTTLLDHLNHKIRDSVLAFRRTHLIIIIIIIKIVWSYQSTPSNRDAEELSLKYVEDTEILVNSFIWLDMGIDKTSWLCYVMWEGRQILNLHLRGSTGLMEIVWFCSACLQTLKVFQGAIWVVIHTANYIIV